MHRGSSPPINQKIAISAKFVLSKFQCFRYSTVQAIPHHLRMFFRRNIQYIQFIFVINIFQVLVKSGYSHFMKTKTMFVNVENWQFLLRNSPKRFNSLATNDKWQIYRYTSLLLMENMFKIRHEISSKRIPQKFGILSVLIAN